MADGSRRLNILCEDKRTERFISRLCERFAIRVNDAKIAPSGSGDASAWVISKFPEFVRLRRSKNYQTNLAFLAAIDGDRYGVVARKQHLERQLAENELLLRGPGEAIALFVPTWSVETWLAHLGGQLGVDEARPLKDDALYRALWRDGPAEADTITRAIEAWNPNAPGLPSLADAYDEARRVGLT